MLNSQCSHADQRGESARETRRFLEFISLLSTHIEVRFEPANSVLKGLNENIYYLPTVIFEICYLASVHFPPSSE